MSAKLPSLTISEAGPYRAAGFFLGVSSLFFVLVTALHINIAVKFFGFSAIAQLLDIFWLMNTRQMIDSQKDSLRLRSLVTTWIWLDVLATAVSATLSALLAFISDPHVTYWGLVIGLGLLSIEGFLDYLWNSRLYFES